MGFRSPPHLGVEEMIVTLEEDPDNPDELILPLPEEILKRLDWKEGDTLDWKDNKDGTWSLKKIKNEQQSE